MASERFEIVDHTADIAIKAHGSTLKELFQNAAFGMFNIIADLEGIKPSAEIEVKADGVDEEELLVAWLEELLYNFYTKSVIFSEFNITELSRTNLTAKVKGRFIGENKNRLRAEIKAATRHELKINKINGRYEAQIVFDV